MTFGKSVKEDYPDTCWGSQAMPNTLTGKKPAGEREFVRVYEQQLRRQSLPLALLAIV